MSNYRIIEPEEKARIFQALANPHRLAILERLTSCCPPGAVREVGDQTRAVVGDIGQDLDIAPSTLSHHLKELTRAGLIKTERRGKNVVCWIDSEMLNSLANYFADLSGGKRIALDWLRKEAGA
jgi:ArsR family transcriptional regulator